MEKAINTQTGGGDKISDQDAALFAECSENVANSLNEEARGCRILAELADKWASGDAEPSADDYKALANAMRSMSETMEETALFVKKQAIISTAINGA